MRRSLCLAALLLATAPAYAQSTVFTATPTSRAAMTAEQGSHYDAIHGYAASPRVVTAALEALDGGREVTFNLADGVELTMVPDRIERYGKDQYSWFGIARAGDEIVGQAVVSVRNGLAMGEFSTSDGMYDLKPLGGSLHALVKVEPNRRFESEVASAQLASLHRDPPMLLPNPSSAAAQRGGVSAYRVLFPYTAEAAAVVPDIALVAQQVIAYANQAYVNSNIGLRAEFAGLIETTMPESSSTDNSFESPLLEDLCRLFGQAVGGAENEDCFGYASDVRAERDRVGADVVTLFRTADLTSTAGIAGVCTGASGAFGVFEIDGTGSGIVFAHEVGHIIGGGHEDSTGCSSFSRAKQSSNEAWRTVMYSSFSNFTTIPYFSNPFVSVQIGTETAIPTGDEDSRDNARTFNARASAVSSFRSAAGLQAVATPQPANPTVQVLPGTTAEVTLDLQNSGLGDLTWWGVTSASPDFAFHTIGELVLGDLDNSGTAVSLVKGSCATGTATTEGFGTVDLPFSFPFNGQVYTQVRVSPRGYIAMDGYDGCSGSVPASIPLAGGPDSYIAVAWSPEIRPASGGGRSTTIYRNVLDDGRLAISWIDLGFFEQGQSSGFFVSAQAILGPDGGVEFRYNSLFRTLVGNRDFQSGGETINVPFSTNIRSGIEYGASEGSEVPFVRLQSAGQVFFPNPALELTDSGRTILPGETGAVPVRINADKLPLGEFTIPLQLLTNAPDAPLLEIPIRVLVVTEIDTEDDPDATLAFTAIGPNPATDEATLAFELATPSDVTVTVFDALGREVRQLELGVQGTGAGETLLDTSALAPGVYVVQLRAGDELRTRRVTVVR